MRWVGIDYSLSCPAIAIYDAGKFSFHYLSNVKKCIGNVLDNNDYTITGYAHKNYINSEERFDQIASWAMSLLKPDDFVNIEGYAFAAAGLVFNIAENCGMLKHKLWVNGNTYQITPPSVAKKFATSKGTANKDAMVNAFIADTGLDMFRIYNTTKAISPINDIADAYFLCKMFIF